MNNKPYGWHCFIGKGKEEQDFLFINGKGASKPDASWDKVISLYTHPVKELTDEDIAKAMVEADPLILGRIPRKVIRDFVASILRKAQE